MSRKKKEDTNNYSKIDVLGILKAIRQRPGMYIGDTSLGPHHAFTEVFDNALDEALSGHCTEIRVNLYDDNKKLVIKDNGRGFPDHRNAEGVHDVVTSCTVAHSSGKFNHSSYGISTGLHGIGITAINAVSSYFKIESIRDGVKTIAEFNDAVLTTPDVIQEKTKEHSGVTVTVVPSPVVFTDLIKFDLTKIMMRLEMAVTFCNVDIYLNDKKIEPLTQKDFAPKIDTPYHEIEVDVDTVAKDGSSVKEQVMLKFGYSSVGVHTDINRGSVNLLRVDNGAHIRVFEKAVSEAWQSLVDSETRSFLNPADYLIGLSGFILVKLADPIYASQTKESLSGTVAKYQYLIKELVPAVAKALKSDRKVFDALLNKFKDYRKNLNRLSTSSYLDEMIEMGENGKETSRKLNFESKLIDCSSKDREGTELFLAEGRSAGGGLIPFRNNKIHAILPLRGKVKNIVDLDIKDIISNAEIRSLINAMGTGCFYKEDPERCRYEKIIIMTDADVDGYSIQALLLGVFLFCTPKTIESGRVYIAETPLFGQLDENGKFRPIWNKDEINPKKHYDRFKGLGSMQAEELAVVAYDKAYRRLKQVTIDDARRALDLIRKSSDKKNLMIEEGVVK